MRNTRRLSGLVLTALALMALPTRAQSVHVVDGAGMGDFLEVQAAVDAAGDGGVVLVRSFDGLYGKFTVEGKSLSILGDSGPSAPEFGGVCTVRGLGAPDTVVLRGLSLVSGSLFGVVLQVHDNLGAVWIEDCLIDSKLAISTTPTGALDVRHSNAVVVARCDIDAAEASTSPISGLASHGLYALDSEVFVFESTIIGSDAIKLSGTPPPKPAAYLDRGLLYFSGCRVEGGPGEHNYTALCPPLLWVCGMPGVAPGDPLGSTHDPIFSVDTDYFRGGFKPGEMPAEPPVPVSPSIAREGPGAARTLEVPSPVRGNETVSMTLTGETGDAVATLLSFAPESFFSADYLGGLLTAWPIVVQFQGFFGSPPVMQVQATFGPLPPSISHFDLYQQIFVFTQFGNPQLGSATAVTYLNQAF